MNKKIKYILGAVALVILVFIAFIKYSPYQIHLLSPLATSTVVVIDEKPKTQQGNTSKTKTYQLSNFTFEYPEYDELAEKVAWEGVPCEGMIYTRNPSIAYESTGVYISTSPTTVCTDFNDEATTLNDYEKDYKGRFYTVIIHSSEKVEINGIPMLKQIYSKGLVTKDRNGKEIFDTSDGTDHELRYVFFDGEKFAIVAGWQASKYVDKIVNSIRLIK